MNADLHDPLKTGHDKIDTQHQELYHLVAMLDRALTQNTHHEIEAIIVFLEHYVEDHFLEEETFMLSKQYQGYPHHKEDHDIFKARVFSLRHDFNSGVPDIRLFFAIRMFIDKLIYHIKTIDVGIAKLVEK